MNAPVAVEVPRLIVEPSFDLPLVSLSVAFRMGALADPEGAEGTTRLMARLMRRSGGGRSAEVIDTEIDSLGGSISADVSGSNVVFHATVIARSLDRFVELLSDVLARPGLGEEEFERLKRETEAELVESLDDDRTLVRRWFRRRMFEGHPYGRPVSGTVSSLKRITLDTVRAQYRRLIVPANAVVSASGHISAEKAAEVSERLLAGLNPGPAIADQTPDPKAPEGRRLVLVDKPERTQTQIIIGGLGSHPSDPDHFALSVANTAFGGTFTARLMNEVRSKRGWSYGAYSNLPYDRRRQDFSMWTFPKASDAAECIKLELGLLEAWRDEGITKTELAWSKRYLVRSHAFAIDTASKRASLALDTALYDLPPGYYERYLDSIKGVTLEAANEAIKARISSDDLWVAVVGTESEIGDAVRSAIPNLGHHEVVPYDRD
jgi:zinc protease